MKLWFLMHGSIMTPWICYLVSLGLFISAVWEKGKKARVAGAMGFLFVGTVILVILILPFNFQVLYNIGLLK